MTSDAEIWRKVSIPVETIRIPEQPQIEGASSEFCGLRFCTSYGEPDVLQLRNNPDTKIGCSILSYKNGIHISIVSNGISDFFESDETKQTFIGVGLRADKQFEFMKQVYTWQPVRLLDFPDRRTDRLNYILALQKSLAMPDCSAIYLFENTGRRGFIYQIDPALIMAGFYDSSGVSYGMSFSGNTLEDVVKILSTVQFSDQAAAS